MIGILGSGFGLYGYLPAIALNSDETILLPERYKAKFLLRNELLNFSHRIRWVETENLVLQNCSVLVLSLNPENQQKWLYCSLLYDNIKYLILEKPLAVSPSQAKIFVTDILNSKKQFRIAYTFIYTDWFKKINSIINNKGVKSITIEWNFIAHHFKIEIENWKRNHSLGGGIIRFYGIHLIALASLWGFTEILSSKTYATNEGDIFKWAAELYNPTLDITYCIKLNSKSNSKNFNINIDSITNLNFIDINMTDPFSFIKKSEVGDFDIRVGLLQELYNSFHQPLIINYTKWYNDINILWEKIEKISIKNT